MRYSVISDSECPLLNITNIGYASDPSVTRFGVGVRNLYIIHYVISGKGYFNGNPVCAGQGFLITPNMRVHYYPDKENPWEFLWVISDDKKMSEIFGLFGADKNTNIFSYDYKEVVKELSTDLIKKNTYVVNPFEMLETFLRIFKHHPKKAVSLSQKTNAEVYIEAAEKYVNANLYLPITVKELTEFLGVSQPYLFTIFKKRLFTSPKQYILDKKLQYAENLLKTTNMPVTGIANSVGFQDVLSFSKFFKSKTGLSPQNYRNMTTRKA